MINEGFEPIVGNNAKVLILGTFPGEESLRRRQYYAHPRNPFWDMIAAICGTGIIDDYEKRCNLVKNRGIAVWDVLKSCDREGSLDARISKDHFIVNDFNSFLSNHPVNVIFFNGRNAAMLFKRHVEPTLLSPQPRLVTLPSTSPAHAALSREQKLEQWLEVRKYLTTSQH